MSEKISQFSTAFATAITAIISKTIMLDGGTYAAVSTMVSIIISVMVLNIYNNISINTIEKIGYHNILGIIIMIIMGILLYKNRWIVKYLYDTIKISEQKEIEIVGSYSIEQVIKYMKHYNTFFKIQTGIRIVDLDIDYSKLNTRIFFIDKNYNVTGYFQFIKRIEENTVSKEKQKPAEQKPAEQKTAEQKTAEQKPAEQKPVEQKSETEIKENNMEYIILKLYKCVCRDKTLCKDPNEYIDKLIKYQYNIENDKYDVSNDTYIIYGDAFLSFKIYINTHKNFYYTTNIVITDVGDISKTIFFPSGNLIRFNDTKKNVRGFIKWIHNSDSHNDEIHLKKCDISEQYSIFKYIEDIKLEINDKKTKRYLTLYSVDKTRMGFDALNVIYDGTSQDVEDLEKIYIQTLFHPRIKEIWNNIKIINYYPEKIIKMGQSPRMNLILHGSPGTGKSTFAYRIAMATKRHILNVRLSKFNKNDMYKIFIQPTIDGIRYKPKDIIFVLDEFDNDLERILLRGAIEMERIEDTKRVVNETFNQIGNGKHMSTEETAKAGEQTKKTENEIGAMDKLIKGINSTYDKIEQIKDEIITYKDLLMIFQGAVPIEGCIIIAMTNNLEGMYDKCPALFRTGRLTPILFDNFNVSMLSEVIKYYFNKELKYSGDIIKFSVQPSTIMATILETNLLDISQEEKYEKIINYLNKNDTLKFS